MSILSKGGDDDCSFPHTSFKFLQSDQIKDAEGKRADDPDYDPRTLHVPDEFLLQQTPMMRQWWDLKSQYYDAILFFKVGNVYELLHMDAAIGVDELGLHFVKGDHLHCRFPELSFAKFSNILVQKGYKVGRVEQTETQNQMLERCENLEHPVDKVVRREVCSVQSRGTKKSSFIDGDCCHADNNFLLAISEKIESSDQSKSRYGVCFVDVTIGTFYVGQFEDDRHGSRLMTLVSHHPPSQVLYEKGKLSDKTRYILDSYLSQSVKEGLRSGVEFWDGSKTLKVLSESDYFVVDGSFKWPRAFDEMVSREKGLGLVPTENYALGLSALGAVVWYLKHCLMDDEVLSIRSFQIYTPVDVTPGPSKKMVLDGLTLLNLEVLINSSTGTVEGTLLQKLDNCKTPFGKRLFKQWLCCPLCSIESITDRQNAIEDIRSAAVIISKVSAMMSKLPDLERLLNKIHKLSLPRSDNYPDNRAVFVKDIYNKRKVKDFITCLEGFKSATSIVEEFEYAACCFKSDLLKSSVKLKGLKGRFPDLTKQFNSLDGLFDHQETKKTGIIKPAKGFNKDYDDALNDIKICEEELAESLEQLKELLHCKTLTYFGTSKNRYQNQEMQMIFNRLASAEGRRDDAQKEVMRCIFEQFNKHRALWTEAISCLCVIDILISLAAYSNQLGMHRPGAWSKENKTLISILNGRHPYLETIVSGSDSKINNFVYSSLRNGHPELKVFGPMKADKPTLMRQFGLTCILAHLGCYIPARYILLTPVDRIFARLGASYHMCGESTSSVELSKTSCMLRHTTKKSLVLLAKEEKPNDMKFKEFLQKLGSDDPITKEAQILLYADFVDKMRDRESFWLRAYFKPILDDLLKEIDEHGKSVELLSSLMKRLTKVLDFFTRNETLATILMDYDCVLKRETFFEKSFLGMIFSLGPDPDLFPKKIEFLTDQIERKNHEFMDYMSHLLYDFILKLFKFGGELKREALLWIGEALRTQMSEVKRHPSCPAVEFNNLLINLQNMLFMFLKPFMNDHSKVFNIQHGYFMATVGSEEERRLRNIHLKEVPDSLLAPLASGEGSSSAPPEDHYETLTEIFYMAHLTFYLGFSAIREKLLDLKLEISQRKKMYPKLLEEDHESRELSFLKIRTQHDLSVLNYYNILLNHSLEKSMEFMAFTANFLVHVAMTPRGTSASSINKAKIPLPSNDLGKSLEQVPEFLVDNIHSLMMFLDRTNDKYFENRSQRKHLESLFEFLILLMYHPSFVSDPFKKVQLAEILDSIFPKTHPNTFRDQLLIKNVNASHAISCVMNVFVAMESARLGSYKDKIRILPTIGFLFNNLCEKELHKIALVELVKDAERRLDYEDAPLFLRFIYLLKEDATYFSSEAEKLMEEIRRIPEIKRQGQPYIDDVDLVRSHNDMAFFAITIFANISQVANHILTHPIMAEIFATVLHSYLCYVVGPGWLELQDKDEFNFNSSWILSKICGIYENFSENDSVLRAISKVSSNLLSEAGGALGQFNGPRRLVKKINQIAARARVLAEEEQDMEDILTDINKDEKFTDCITFGTMTDPVSLGDSGQADRKSFIKHLLWSNRHPITNRIISMAIMEPLVDMKEEIEGLIKAQLIARRQAD